MNWIFSSYFYVYIISTILSMFFCIYLFRRRFMPGAKSISMLMLCISIWSFFGALELSVQETAWKTTFSKFQYIGIVGVSPFWIIFVANFTGMKNKLFKSPYKLIFGLIPLIIFVLAITNEFHGLIWSSLTTQTTDIGVIQIYNYGFFVYINVVYAYTLILIGTIRLFWFMFSSVKFQKQQILLVIIAAIVPWIANFFYLFKLNPLPGVELTPLAFTITGILFSFSIFKYQLFELVPFAKKMLFATIDIGFIIMDENDVIVEANSAAKNILGLNLQMGTNIKTALNSFPSDIVKLLDQEFLKKEIQLSNFSTTKWIEITLNQINGDDRSSETGKLLVLHDISKRKAYEREILESKANLSVIIENTSDLIVYVDREQKILIFNKSFSDLIKNTYNVVIEVGMSAVDFLPQDEKEWWSSNNQRGLNGDRFTVESQKQIGDKTFYFETSFNPIVIQDKIIGVSDFTRDISERKSFEKELESKVKELERVNRLMVDRELKMIDLKKEIKSTEPSLENQNP